jgi:hypothetical protein
MARIIYGARGLRLEAQQRTGKLISVQKAADGITAKMRELSGDSGVEMGRNRLSNYELGKIFETKTLELLGISAYYGEILGRTINTNDIVGIDPINNKRGFSQVQALQP